MELNIADLFESLADAIPERTALVCGDKRLTFAELDERATRMANALRARGVRAGDHVGLYLYNGAEFVESMLGAFKIRAVPININYRYVEGELSYLFENAKLVALVHQRELSAHAAAAAHGIASLKTFIAVADGGEAANTSIDSVDYESALRAASAKREFDKRSGDDLYVIYTGGTTGMPRGVMWRHEDVFYAGLQGGRAGGEPIANPEELAVVAKQSEEPLTFLPAAPLIHGAAQWSVFIGLFGGGKVVLQPGRSFNAKIVCELIEREKVSTLTFVGDAMARPLVEALRAPGAKYDTSSLFVIASAGAVLSDSVKDDLTTLLPNTMVLNSFGATETGHQGTTGAFPTEGGVPSGRPSFFMDDSNTVLGDDMRPLTPGSATIGKLARRGRLPIGYFNDPEKTAKTFVTIDGERWVVPGDLAMLEEDGRITVLGRGAVCINSGGEKIFPEEVESVLKAHPAVLDAVVVGIPDERWGQRVAAIVQPREGAAVTLAELEAFCRTRIAGYKVPRELTIVAEVVRHPSGKPDYRWASATARGESA
jgi:acyl-CoA synthetase (AMP-forming)/AMP-acid ligase II